MAEDEEDCREKDLLDYVRQWMLMVLSKFIKRRTVVT